MQVFLGRNRSTGPTPETSVRHGRPTVIAATVICAASMLGLGVWAFVAPASFSRFIDYAPYNRHLIHDVGAFQIGIGVSLFLALAWTDALFVALSGFVVASALHTLSHAVDRHIGGHASDVPTLGLLTILALYAMAARPRPRHRIELPSEGEA
jgi:hypothetical protein